MKDFVAENFVIEDFNLEENLFLEASAGTGKTYSLEHLLLRLVVEQGQSLHSVLLITFTNKAAAELRARVGSRLRECLGALPGDSQLVNRGLAARIKERFHCNLKEGDSTAKLRTHLEDELTNLDQAKISTIHAFCLSMLTENPQLSGLAPGFSILSEQAIERRMALLTRQYCEEQGYTASETQAIEKVISDTKSNLMAYPVAYEDLTLEDLVSVEQIKDLVVPEISEEEIKKFVHGTDIPAFLLMQSAMQSLVTKGETLSEKAAENPFQKVAGYLNGNKNIIRSKGNPKQEFIERIAYFQPAHLDVLLASMQAYQQGKFTLSEKLLNSIKTIRTSTAESKRQNSEILQNDFIQLLHKNINKFSPVMGDQLSCIIIDEFQDTDLPQWEIFFNTANTNNIPLWVVGDPKQAIYSFRGGDIETYFRARGDLSSLSKGYNPVKQLTTNYRSGSRLGDAFNRLFVNDNWFNPSLGKKELMPYLVTSSLTGVDLNYVKNLKSGFYPVLLQSENQFYERAADIIQGQSLLEQGTVAVLVRSWRQANQVVTALQKRGIPYESTGNPKESREAMETKTLLEAVENPAEFQQRLLLTRFGPYEPENAADLEKEKEKVSGWVFYKKLQSLAAHKAWPSFFSCLKEESYLSKRLAGEADPLGVLLSYEQIWSSILDMAQGSQMSLAELIDHFEWDMANKLQKDELEEDYITSATREENVVQVMTIHKSKGLEYDSVFVYPYEKPPAPQKTHWSLGYQKKSKITRLAYGKPREDTIFKYQQEYSAQAEARRLHYVACTRAKKNLFYYFNEDHFAIDLLKDYDVTMPVSKQRASQQTPNEKLMSRFVDMLETGPGFKGRGSSYQSYTSLSKKVTLADDPSFKDDEIETEIITEQELQYNLLPRGAQFGTQLHACLEQENWDVILQEPKSLNLGRYLQGLRAYSQKDDIEKEKMVGQLQKMLQNTLLANLELHGGTLRLGDEPGIPQDKEADFVLSLNGRASEINLRFLQGSIDLVFLYKDYYYILDWKSNLLSAAQVLSPGNYTREKYGLQQKIYKLALYEWLKSRQVNPKWLGGTIYLYCRHAMQGTSQGVDVQLQKEAYDYEAECRELLSYCNSALAGGSL